MKTDLFQSWGHCCDVQIFWHIECSTFTASSFSIRNSSTGIPSPPLALYVMMLSKAHLTSNSRMSGSRSVITPSWLSGTWRSFWRVLMQFLATSSWYLLLLLGAYLFWVDFPIKQELLHSVSWHQCMFQSKTLSRTHSADLCMQHNGGDPSVFVSPMEKLWRHSHSPHLRNLQCNFISL